MHFFFFLFFSICIFPSFFISICIFYFSFSLYAFFFFLYLYMHFFFFFFSIFFWIYFFFFLYLCMHSVPSGAAPPRTGPSRPLLDAALLASWGASAPCSSGKHSRGNITLPVMLSAAFAPEVSAILSCSSGTTEGLPPPGPCGGAGLTSRSRTYPGAVPGRWSLSPSAPRFCPPSGKK